jgi:hypothetical protein
MVISPLLRGLFGLQTDAITHKVVLAPHIPADWNSFSLHNVHAGQITLGFEFHRNFDEISLRIESSASASIEFSPAICLRARILDADLNGKRTAFQISTSDVDQHVTVRVSVPAGKSTVRIRLRNDFGLTFNNVLPYLGSQSQSLHIVSETWSASRDSLTLEPKGLTAAEYELSIWNPKQISSVEGAEVRGDKLVLQMAPNPHELIVPQQIVIHFAKQ